MILETGYVYHIKNEYFEFVKDDKLMKNHENGSSRPTYFCIKNGICDTIVIGKYRGSESAFLIQNIFPITEKYIDHIDVIRNKAISVVEGTKSEITAKVNKIFMLKSKRNKSNISRCR